MLLAMKDFPDIFNCRRSPGRYTYAETAARIGGATETDIVVLVRLGLLKPLGRPPQNGRKYLAAADVEACIQDRHWLEKATRALYAYHKNRNSKTALDKRASSDLSGRNAA